MGIVTNHLIQLVARQVEDAGLVVWYDPELAYTAVAEQFKLPRTTVARYTDSFLSLRRDVDGTELDEVVIDEPGETSHA